MKKDENFNQLFPFALILLRKILEKNEERKAAARRMGELMQKMDKHARRDFVKWLETQKSNDARTIHKILRKKKRKKKN